MNQRADISMFENLGMGTMGKVVVANDFDNPMRDSEWCESWWQRWENTVDEIQDAVNWVATKKTIHEAIQEATNNDMSNDDSIIDGRNDVFAQKFMDLCRQNIAVMENQLKGLISDVQEAKKFFATLRVSEVFDMKPMAAQRQPEQKMR